MKNINCATPVETGIDEYRKDIVAESEELYGLSTHESIEALFFLNKKSQTVEEKTELVLSAASAGGPYAEITSGSHFSLWKNYSRARRSPSLCIKQATRALHENPRYAKEFFKKIDRKSSFTPPFSKAPFFGCLSPCYGKSSLNTSLNSTPSVNTSKLTPGEAGALESLALEPSQPQNYCMTEGEVDDFSPFSILEDGAMNLASNHRLEGDERPSSLGIGDLPFLPKTLLSNKSNGRSAIGSIIEKHSENKSKKFFKHRNTLIPHLF